VVDRGKEGHQLADLYGLTKHHLIDAERHHIAAGVAAGAGIRDLIKQLEADGWYLRASKGSHHIFIHPRKPGHISVPPPKTGSRGRAGS
jgi:hypothetical protein